MMMHCTRKNFNVGCPSFVFVNHSLYVELVALRETRARSEVTEFGQADLYSGRGRGETILGFAQRTDSLVD